MDERRRRRIQQRKRRRRKQLIRRMSIIFILLLIILLIIIFSSGHRKEKAACEMLDNFYTEFTNANGLETDSDNKTDFSEWFVDEYLNGKAKKILSTTENNTLTDSILYEISGESMHVLYDRYQGNVTEESHIYEKEGQTDGEAEITIAGDLCFAEDGYVLDKYDQTGNLSDCISPELLDIMTGTDIFYLNHEYCISDQGTPLQGKYYTFRANPERMSLLEEMGTDLVSLANNHVYDYGEDSLIDTTELLKNNSIPYVGGGVNIADAKQPVYFIVNGIKIGFVAASNAEKNRYTPQATEDSAGILLAYDTTEYNEVIENASKECDYLIAYIHWGTEDSNVLNSEQQEMGREFLDSGADIVVGGHPHVLQGMEYVDGKPIIYSLGDFWFNGETKYTGLLQLHLNLDGLQEMTFVPCQQTNYTTQYLETPEEQEALYTFLERLSINIDIDENGVITETN